jgi:hypothetical protein
VFGRGMGRKKPENVSVGDKIEREKKKKKKSRKFLTLIK